ncbi:hypothetical protein Tco_0767171 [Tanacetum coccineum]
MLGTTLQSGRLIIRRSARMLGTTLQTPVRNLVQLVELVRNAWCCLFHECIYRAADPGFYHRNNVKLRTRMKESMEDTLRKFMSESAKRHEENSNLIKEIRASTDAAIRNQGASIKTLEIQIGKMSKLIHTQYAVLDPPNMPRNQGDDLMPTIEEGEVIEEFKTRDDELDTRIDDYPSYCDYDKKIHIDCAHNLKFSCMIGFEFTHANFFPLLYVNVMSKKFHNSIMKDKMVYKGNNVVGALMNVPIFVGTFSVVTDFVVLENMDAYRNEGIGDVSEEDKKNEISHPYQKLKGFYKGVLNLGPDYIRDARTEEWLTRGHISVHEME